MSDDKVTQNHWGSGHNINAGTVNIGHQPFVLTEQGLADVVVKIGDAPTVKVRTYGPMGAAFQFVKILGDALGRPVGHQSHTDFENWPPPAGISVSREGDTARVSFNPT